MKDAIKTAKEQFKNCTWYGDAGEALPARHVAPLFAEINRLRNYVADREAKVLQQSKTIEQYRHRIGALECTNGVLQDFKTHYSDMAKSLGFDSISDMAVKAKSLRLDLGLVKISLDHKTTLLDSCEKALAERDEKVMATSSTIDEIELQIAWRLEEQLIGGGIGPDQFVSENRKNLREIIENSFNKHISAGQANSGTESKS
jgi:hypothetical protein